MCESRLTHRLLYSGLFFSARNVVKVFHMGALCDACQLPRWPFWFDSFYDICENNSRFSSISIQTFVQMESDSDLDLVSQSSGYEMQSDVEYHSDSDSDLSIGSTGESDDDSVAGNGPWASPWVRVNDVDVDALVPHRFSAQNSILADVRSNSSLLNFFGVFLPSEFFKKIIDFTKSYATRVIEAEKDRQERLGNARALSPRSRYGQSGRPGECPANRCSFAGILWPLSEHGPHQEAEHA